MAPGRVRQAMAAYAAACSVVMHRRRLGAVEHPLGQHDHGEVPRRVGTSQDVPNPPSQPNAPARGPSVTTDVQNPQPRPSRKPASPPRAFWAGVSWSRVISRDRVRGQHRIPAAQQHAREREQVVGGGDQPGGPVAERRRPAPLALGRVPDLQPVGGRGPVRRREPAGVAVQNPVSRMPSGSKIRVRSTSANDWPAARASKTPSTEAPVL